MSIIYQNFNAKTPSRKGRNIFLCVSAPWRLCVFIVEERMVNIDIVLAPYHEVLGRKQQLPSKLTQLVQSYFSKKERWMLDTFAQFLNPLPRFLDLTNSRTLSSFLAPDFRSSLHKALNIARSIYQVGAREIVGNTYQYGYTFCMNPEILAHAMKLARGEVVVEIGGAGGEHSIFFALVGASRVYMNDITSEQIDAFRFKVRKFPFNVGEKLESVEANCLDLAKIKPELVGKVGLVFCRNVIHFFPEREIASYFSVLRQLLKPGGRAILTANSAYASPRLRPLFEAHPEATYFVRNRCHLFDKKANQITKLDFDHSILQTAPKSLGYRIFPMYKKKAGEPWEVTAGQTLDPILREKAEVIFAPHRDLIEEGRVEVVQTFPRIFTKDNLSDLVKWHGFKVESTFVTGFDGHLVHDKDLYKKGHQVGVILS